MRRAHETISRAMHRCSGTTQKRPYMWELPVATSRKTVTTASAVAPTSRPPGRTNVQNAMSAMICGSISQPISVGSPPSAQSSR